MNRMELRRQKLEVRDTKSREMFRLRGRKMWGVRCAVTGLSAALMLALASCGAGRAESAASGTATQKNQAAYDAGMSYGYMEAAEAYTAGANMDMISEEGTAVTGSGTAAPTVDNSAYFDERKLIKTVNLQVETKEFDVMLAAVEEQVVSLGGYIENLDTYNGSRYSGREASRHSYITVRIPRQQLDGFVSAVSEIGNVTSRSENVEDVTLSYVDLESRRNSLQTEQKRLQELLEVADNLEDILTIEERLSTVRYQLESMESQLRTYDNKVDFSTVYLDIQEVKELTPVEEETTWERITNGFRDSLLDVKDGLVDFFVWFVVSIPYLVIWAVVILVIVMIVKLIIRSRRRKKEERIRRLQSVQPSQGISNIQNPQPSQSVPNGQDTQQNEQK